jgi:hypothetical protein
MPGAHTVQDVVSTTNWPSKARERPVLLVVNTFRIGLTLCTTCIQLDTEMPRSWKDVSPAGAGRIYTNPEEFG